MKFRVTMKNPDAIHNALHDLDLDPNDELPAGIDSLIDKFMKYGEYITVEFDTEDQTAVVVPV